MLNLQRRAHLLWEEGRPRTVLLVKKANSADASAMLHKVAAWCAPLLRCPAFISLQASACLELRPSALQAGGPRPEGAGGEGRQPLRVPAIFRLRPGPRR